MRILYQCVELEDNFIKRIISGPQTTTHNVEHDGTYEKNKLFPALR